MQTLDLYEYLKGLDYPGRGILLGKSADGKKAVIGYFIMGRSANSRNRIFVPVEEDQGIRTEAFDPSKMEDPSLIIYHPMRVVARTGDTVVTNGDQTDTVRDYLQEGKVFAQALRTRTYEPDGPNYTPRISGLVHPDGSYALSILKSADGDPSCTERFFFGYDDPVAGVGHLIHTYQVNGEPLPSFEGEPRKVAIPTADAGELADGLWEALNEDNKVSLFVRVIDIASGKTEDVILNKNKQ